MDSFNAILIAFAPGHLDTSSLRRAARVAADNGASVTVLDVVEPLPERRRFVRIDGRRVDVQRLLVHERTNRLHHLAAVTGLDDAEMVVKVGKPIIEVIREAVSNGCDTVIVGNPAPVQGRPAGMSAGVMRLLRKCPVPVWVMRPSRARTLRIMALVDPDPSDPARNALNHDVLELATSMAVRQGGDLHVAHAWHMPGETILASSSYVSFPAAELEIIVAEDEAEHHHQLEALTEAHAVADAGGTAHLVKGEAGVVLPELARRLKINLIVMGTVGRSGVGGLIMGTTAETILRGVDCSVIALKPPGFRSPVRVGRRKRKASG